jgi:hypothetical protein
VRATGCPLLPAGSHTLSCDAKCSTNVPTAPYDVQMAAGAKVASRFAAMLPGLGITPDSIPVIERRFRWQLAVLEVRPLVCAALRVAAGGRLFAVQALISTHPCTLSLRLPPH